MSTPWLVAKDTTDLQIRSKHGRPDGRTINRGHSQISRPEEDPDQSLSHLRLSREDRSDGIVGRAARVVRPI